VKCCEVSRSNRASFAVKGLILKPATVNTRKDHKHANMNQLAFEERILRHELDGNGQGEALVGVTVVTRAAGGVANVKGGI